MARKKRGETDDAAQRLASEAQPKKKRGCFGRIFGCAGLVVLLAVGAVVVLIVVTGGDGDNSAEVPPQQADDSTTGPTTTGVVLAAYTIYSEEQVDPPNQRRRWVLRATMDPNANREAKIAGLAAAVREGLATHPDATCIVLFAYIEETDSDIVDIGRAFVSTDGGGLNGEGMGLISEDTGDIQIEIAGETETEYAPKDG